MGGLHDGGHGDLDFSHALEHAHSVEVGHDKIEDDEIDRRTVGRLQPRQRPFARFGGLDLIAEAPNHRLQ